MAFRTRCQEVLQKRHFADNTDKGYNNGPIIDQLNESFQVVFSNVLGQSIDEHTAKFKGRSSMRQYLKMKPIKWEFIWWFRCASSTGSLYEFDLYLRRIKYVDVSLGESMVMQLSENL